MSWEDHDVKELFRRGNERFGREVHAIGYEQWTGPTPCTEWDVRVLVNHLVSENRWLPPLLGGKTIADVGDALEGDLLGADPKASWDVSAGDAVAAVEDTPLDRTTHLSYGPTPAGAYIFEVFTDLVIHGWDLARAIGAEERIDPDLVELIFDELEPKARSLKTTGLFGPDVTPPPGADLQTRLLALVGRVA